MSWNVLWQLLWVRNLTSKHCCAEEAWTAFKPSPPMRCKDKSPLDLKSVSCPHYVEQNIQPNTDSQIMRHVKMIPSASLILCFLYKWSQWKHFCPFHLYIDTGSWRIWFLFSLHFMLYFWEFYLWVLYSDHFQSPFSPSNSSCLHSPSQIVEVLYAYMCAYIYMYMCIYVFMMTDT